MKHILQTLGCVLLVFGICGCGSTSKELQFSDLAKLMKEHQYSDTCLVGEENGACGFFNENNTGIGYNQDGLLWVEEGSPTVLDLTDTSAKESKKVNDLLSDFNLTSEQFIALMKAYWESNEKKVQKQIASQKEENEKTVEKQKEEPPKESATTEQRNALKAALDYLRVMPFSYSRLISQLEYEGYAHEEAVYGADHCGADWSKQALKSAKNYLSTMAFSYSSLIQQLEYEGFSSEDATYAADSCGADWNQQAAKSAQNYLDTMSFSRDELMNQLLYEGFSQEQAEYGVNAVGY